MTERPPEEKPLPTIWRVPDELWEKIEPILKEHDPSKNTGRPRVNQRAVLDAFIFRLRTGCQWNRLPSEFPDEIPPCIALSSGGLSLGFWLWSGLPSSRSARRSL